MIQQLANLCLSKGDDFHLWLRDYAEWDYEYQTGEHVKIEIVKNWMYITDFTAYEIHVGYKHFTSEDLGQHRTID